MRRNTTKMHTFYTADAQEHCKTHTFYTADAQEHPENAYILYRGCAGTRQKCIHSIPRMRRNTTKMHPGAVLGPPAGRANFWKKNRPPEHGEISSKKGHPDRFRAIPDQVPEKCFFQGYRLWCPDAQNAGKHVYSIRRIAQNTEKHVYSIRRIGQNTKNTCIL